jgi:hypothetical protein
LHSPAIRAKQSFSDAIHSHSPNILTGECESLANEKGDPKAGGGGKPQLLSNSSNAPFPSFSLVLIDVINGEDY